MCLHGALCSIFFNLICNMTTFRRKKCFDFDPTQGSRVCVKSEYMYMLACCCIRDSLQFDMQHNHVLKKLNFDIRPTPRVGRGLQAKYLLPCCCMRHFLKFVMQHDHILKKFNSLGDDVMNAHGLTCSNLLETFPKTFNHHCMSSKLLGYHRWHHASL